MRADYAELQVTTNFSFLEGASHPHELVEQAKALGHRAIAITDRNTLAGVVRGWQAAKQAKLRFIVGCRLDFQDRPSLLCYPTDRAAYGRLSSLLTLGKRRAPKGECHLYAADLAPHAEGQILAIVPPDRPDPDFAEWTRKDAQAFRKSYFIIAQCLYRGDDAARIAWLDLMAHEAGARLLATNDVLYHAPERRALQDVVSCIRLKCTIETAGLRLAAHAERHLKPPSEMSRLFKHFPDSLQASLDIAARCRFDMSELKYDYPIETEEGRRPQAELAARVEAGVAERYPEGVPLKVRAAIVRELALIESRDYAPYFLTVHDIVKFAKSKDILCQGRGSAANSAVCYVLGITAVDPNQFDLLFERFISTARNEPPDIDVDFAHERREDVIQHIYRKYGRDRTGIAATVICYRMRSAVREVGKVMGLSVDAIAAMSKLIWGWSNTALKDEQIVEAGLDPTDLGLRRILALATELVGFPRHLSQHVGGFVITQGPLSELVPICNAAMENRTNIEWDKDDIDALKILKVDVLGLGMLTCIDKAFALAKAHYGADLTLYTVPRDDPEVYGMIQRADTIGVFQIESRAQMSMLPRLRPERFYDLVVEVAIVRPGPIQGDMVHPYLKRRDQVRRGETIEYPSAELEAVLHNTLGVPLFQEQAMKIAMVGAKFTADEADGLRRAMATFKNPGTLETFCDRFIDGMIANGYERDFAERCFNQIRGFGNYGFPESHAVSFALLAYVSSWLKYKYPGVFACALLNSQPMGFYQPAQIVRDLRDHGVEVRPVDINRSAVDSTLEGGALRLGLREVNGLNAKEAERLVERRGAGYRSPDDLARRGGLNRSTLEALARADAFRSVGLDRRAALWAVKAKGEAALPLFAALDGPLAEEPVVTLPAMTLGEHVLEDYDSVGLSLKSHPLAFLREGLGRRGIVSCAALRTIRPGRRVEVAGLVLVRQRPGTGNAIFMTLEDETGIANAIIWPAIFERFRKVIMAGRLVTVRGILQNEQGVIHIVTELIADRTAELGRLDEPFRLPPVRSDGDEPSLRLKSRNFH